MKQLAIVEKNKNFWFLLIISLIFFLLRFPSLFEPYWYGDEGIYHVIGMAINQGRELYTEIWDNKPPLLYIIYALLNSDQFNIRLVSLVFGALSVFAFYFLAKKLFSSQKITYIATVFFAILFATPLIEGNIANAENFMLLPILLSAHLVFKSRLLFVAGVLLSLAFLIKIVAIFDFLAFFLFISFIYYKKGAAIKNVIQRIAPFIIGFLIPIGITAIILFLQGSFTALIQSVFLQMFGYVGHGNKLVLPQGLLFVKLLLLLSAVLFLFRRRTIYTKGFLFVLLWFAFSLFNAFFAQRPYTHYLLVLLPSIILLLGFAFLEKTYKKTTILILFVSLILIMNSFRMYGKPISYYANFLLFITNNKSFSSYLNFFDRRTSKNYEVAQYVKFHTRANESIFLWGNSAQIYALANKLPPGRFIVAYHAKASSATLQETQREIIFAKPKYIIIESGEDFIPYALLGYSQKITIHDTIIYERTL